MAQKLKRTDEGHEDAKASIRPGCCIDVVANVMLKIAPDTNSRFVANKVSSVIKFVGEDPFEWQHLLALWVVN
jgi:hypothetical protein